MKYLKKYEFSGVSQDSQEEDLTTYEKVEKSIREYDEVEDIEEHLKNFMNDPEDGADIDKSVNYENDSLYKIVSESIIDNEWNMEVMDVLAKYGAKLNRNNRYGYTPLFYFAESEDEELFEHFLEIGVKNTMKDVFDNDIIPADIKHKDNAGGDVLHHYLNRYGKDLDFFKFMIEKGANVQNLTDNGDTLLFLHISSTKIFDYLLTIIDVNIKNKEGKNALCYVKSQDVKRFKKVLELTDDIDVADGFIFKNTYGDVKNYFKTYSFQSFIGEKHPHCFKYLIDNGIEIDKRIAEEYDYIISGGDMGLM